VLRELGEEAHEAEAVVEVAQSIGEGRVALLDDVAQRVDRCFGQVLLRQLLLSFVEQALVLLEVGLDVSELF